MEHKYPSSDSHKGDLLHLSTLASNEDIVGL